MAGREKLWQAAITYHFEKLCLRSWTEARSKLQTDKVVYKHSQLLTIDIPKQQKP